MRIIEQYMIQAIQERRNWKSRNTRVKVFDHGVTVELHDNLIAAIDPGRVFFFTQGYRTNTTKSRLNAIAKALRVKGVYQKDFEWYYTDDTPFVEGSWQERKA